MDDNSQILKNIKKESSDSSKLIESGTEGLHSNSVNNDQNQGNVPPKKECESIILNNVFGPAGIHRPLYIVPNISDGSDFISDSISPLTSYQRDRINDIITICNKNVEDQKSCVESLLKICSKLSDLDGGEDYVSEITLICNKILSETCKKSLSIIGLCQAFTESFPSKPNKRKKTQGKKPGEVIPCIDVTIPAPSTSKTQTEEEAVTVTIKTECVSDNETFQTNDDPDLDIDICDSDSPDLPEIQNAKSATFPSDTDSCDETEKVPPVMNEQVAQCDSMPVSSDSDSCNKTEFDGGTVKDQAKTSIHQTKSNKKEGSSSTIQKLLFLSQIQCSSKRKRKLPKRIQEQVKATEILFQGELEKDEKGEEDEGDDEKHKGDEKGEGGDKEEEEEEEADDEDEDLLDVESDDEEMDPSWSLTEDKNDDSDKNEVETSITEKKFACVHCDKKFTTLSLSEKHEKKHTCPICHKIFSLSYMSIHKNDHKSNSKDSKSKYICDKCGAVFKQSRLLKEHILTHHCDVSVRPFPCNQCDSKFINITRLKYHQQSVHEKLKKYQCDQCGFRTAWAINFKDHMQKHTGVRPFQCDVCQKSFFSKRHLFNHKRIHSVFFKYTCKVCKKGFNQGGNLKTHMRTHTGEKPYICTKCGIGFSHNVTRKQHMKTCSGPP